MRRKRNLKVALGWVVLHRHDRSVVPGEFSVSQQAAIFNALRYMGYVPKRSTWVEAVAQWPAVSKEKELVLRRVYALPR